MASGITGNPWIDVPLFLGASFLGGDGGDSGVPWQQEEAAKQAYVNSVIMNPIQMGLYGNLAAMSGIPEQTLRQYYMGLPAHRGTRVLGWQPQSLYTGLSADIKKGGQTWAERAGAPAPPVPQQTTGSTWLDKVLGWDKRYQTTPPPVTTPPVSPPETTPPTTMPETGYTGNENMMLGGDVWSQSYMASQYNQAMPMVNQEAQGLAQRLIEQGWNPDQANQVAANWAMEQKSKFKLQAASQLPQFYRDTTMAALGLQPMSSVSNTPQVSSPPDTSANDFWSAAAGFANVLGQNKAQKTQVGSTYTAPMSYAGQMGGTGYGYGSLPTFQSQLGPLFPVSNP